MCIRDRCYHLGHHVVRRFDVMGVVVDFDVKANPRGGHRLLFALDDGSAVVNCLAWRNDPPAGRERELPLGSLLRVKGRMSTFREQRQLVAFEILPERDPLAEPLRWLELERLWRGVYSADPRPTIAALVKCKRGERGGPRGDGGLTRAAQAVLTGADVAPPPELVAVRDAIVRMIRRAPERPAAACEAANGDETLPASCRNDVACATEARLPPPLSPPFSFAYSSLLDERCEVFLQALRSAAPVAATAATADGAARRGDGGGGDRLHAAAKALVQRAVHSLKTDGVLELVDADADAYAPFDAERQLLPAILRHVARAAGRCDGDITLARLRAELQQHERHAFVVSDATLRTAVEVLLERSQLYETGRDVYRAL